MADGVYGFDPNTLDLDNDPEEAIALAGTVGFEASTDIRADQYLCVDGTQLRYSDRKLCRAARPPAPRATPRLIPRLAALSPSAAISARLTILAGTAYGSEASGIRPSTPAEFSNRDAFVLTNGSGSDRFPIRAGTDGGDITQPLTASEVTAILEEAFRVMSRARAQIRQPLDSRAQVSISMVDTRGAVLGIVPFARCADLRH